MPSNLDCMTADELRRFAANVPTSIPGPIREDLARYAICRSDAIDCRQGGNLVWATWLDADCEAIYSRLPAAYQW